MSRFALLASGLSGLLALVGCGDDGAARIPDAPPLPDGPDVIPSGPVNVTTLARCCIVTPLTPQAGVVVVAVQPDGSVGDSGTSDAEGKVTLDDVQEGATIAALYPEDADNRTQLSTIGGVKPGDELTFGDNYFRPDAMGTSPGGVTLQVPALPGLSSYEVLSPCGYFYGGASASMTVSTYEHCQTPTAPLALVAFGNDGPLASGFLPAAPFTDGAVATLSEWVPNTDVAISISGLDERTYLDLYGVAAYPLMPYDFYVDGDGEGSSYAGTVAMPATAPRTYALARLGRDGLPGRQRAFRAGSSPIALTAPALPWLAGVVVSADAGQAVWLQTPGTSDATVLRMMWYRPGGDEGYRYYFWNAILPPGTGKLDLDVPSPALQAFLPAPGDRVYLEVSLIDLASTADYDAVRAVPEWLATDPEAAVAAGDETTAALSYTADGGEGFAAVSARTAPRRR